MTSAVTFSSVTIPSFHIDNESAIGALTYEVTLTCRTGTKSDITSHSALQGHIGITRLASGKTRIQTSGGTKGTLTINGVAHPNCYIADLTWKEAQNSLPFERWEFTVKFVEETI